MIKEYGSVYNCELIVIVAPIGPHGITLFEEALWNANSKRELHIMLWTMGGDAESALRMVRMAQERCSSLAVIIPDRAKSAGTLFAMGADKLLLGPTSDLGPIDPQFQISEGKWTSAQSIIAAVNNAEAQVTEMPATYPIHVALLSDVTSLMVQNAHNAIGRTGDQLKEALSCAKRDEKSVEDLADRLRGPLIEASLSHGTMISSKNAKDYGLPVEEADPRSDQWRMIWKLWTKYYTLNSPAVFESAYSSHVEPTPQKQS